MADALLQLELGSDEDTLPQSPLPSLNPAAQSAFALGCSPAVRTPTDLSHPDLIPSSGVEPLYMTNEATPETLAVSQSDINPSGALLGGGQRRRKPLLRPTSAGFGEAEKQKSVPGEGDAVIPVSHDEVPLRQVRFPDPEGAHDENQTPRLDPCDPQDFPPNFTTDDDNINPRDTTGGGTAPYRCDDYSERKSSRAWSVWGDKGDEGINPGIQGVESPLTPANDNHGIVENGMSNEGDLLGSLPGGLARKGRVGCGVENISTHVGRRGRDSEKTTGGARVGDDTLQRRIKVGSFCLKSVFIVLVTPMYIDV
jgi:hypothetical protein